MSSPYTQEQIYNLFRPRGMCGQLIDGGERVCIQAVGHEGHVVGASHSMLAAKTSDAVILATFAPDPPAPAAPPCVAESDVIPGAFYWVWVDPSDRHTPNLPPVLVVATAWRATAAHGERNGDRLMWEGCGTDEGVRVLLIVAKVASPVRVRELERALNMACDHATTHLPEDREIILECRRIAKGDAR